MIDIPDKKCDHCGNAFTPKVRTQLYCSYRCYDNARYARKKAAWKSEGDFENERRAKLAATNRS